MPAFKTVEVPGAHGMDPTQMADEEIVDMMNRMVDIARRVEVMRQPVRIQANDFIGR